MHLVKTFEPTDSYSPGNPLDRTRDVYVQGSPGGYQSFYFKRLANDSSLSGISSTWGGLPVWGQVTIVGLIAATAGYFGMAKYGDRFVKPALKKVGINLSGPRTRRRR
jgi:hypothetical protein